MSFITEQMKSTAKAFSQKWNGTAYEKGEAQTFTNELFKIFGIDRHSVARFERQIKRKKTTVFVDTFWPGKLLIEAKSANKDKEKDWEDTLNQAVEYVEDLELFTQKPKFILLTNFKRFRKFKVEFKSPTSDPKITFLKEVLLENLSSELEEFSFFPQFIYELEKEEEQVNQEATKRIAGVNKAITQKIGKTKETGLFLARILFCLFAEDTNIFKEKQFEYFIRNQTNGNNLKEQLLLLFETLNTPIDKRKKSIPNYINAFPYVNGGLFADKIVQLKNLDDTIKDSILYCCSYDWSLISPVIFGALFQSLIRERRETGAHYTSERNIQRVVKPLFLDALNDEFELIKNDLKLLNKFRQKINQLIFLDPACGCGNFLVVTYKELRLLDIDIIRQKIKLTKQLPTSVNDLVNIRLDHFYGYEIDQTSCLIAEVAMWLAEHQLNQDLIQFGIAVPTIPLDESAVINCENALNIDWKTLSKFTRGIGDVHHPFDYIIGNPPFVGKQYQSEDQKADMDIVWNTVKGSGVLDYVTCWYIKSAQYIKNNPKTRVALVSTNSIAQGEQTGILWNELFNKYHLKIQFVHQTFKWGNDAIDDSDQAAVHCVIIGFGKEDLKEKYIFEYADIKKEPKVKSVKNINPYLVAGSDTVILKRGTPICNVPEIVFGSMPNDGGHLLLTDEEKRELIKKEPEAKKWIKPLISAHEYLNGKTRWCLWLMDSQSSERRSLKLVNQRILAVKKHREDSNRKATNKLAITPWLFGERRQPKSNYVAIPRVSSENRYYVPMEFYDKKNILSDTCLCVPNATLYHFGVLISSMHMTWMRYVCGRLKSDYRYSNEIVYNNYPWPKDFSKKKHNSVEVAVEILLQIRNTYLASGNTLADLYYEGNMPSDLRHAHEVLDKAVDKCYRDSGFISEQRRIEFLFGLYEEYINGIFGKEEKKKKL